MMPAVRSLGLGAGVALILAGTASAADWRVGKQAYDAGDYTAALREWIPLGQANDARAEYGVGVLLLYGRGLDRDPGAAAALFAKAADLGDAAAAYALGVMAEDGDGMPRNLAEAARRYAQAAEAGNGDAQNNLGVLYAAGAGVPASRAEAYFWFVEGAANGNAAAGANRDRIAKQMSAAEFADAERRMFDNGHTGVVRPAARSLANDVDRPAAEVLARLGQRVAPPAPPMAEPVAVAEIPVVPPAPATEPRAAATAPTPLIPAAR